MALNDKSKTITYILLGLLVIGAAIIIYLVMKNKKKDAERKKQLEAEMQKLMGGNPRYAPKANEQKSTPPPVEQKPQQQEASIEQKESEFNGKETNAAPSALESNKTQEAHLPSKEKEEVSMLEPAISDNALKENQEAIKTIEEDETSQIAAEKKEIPVEDGLKDNLESSNENDNEDNDDDVKIETVVSDLNDELPIKWAAFILGVDNKMWIEFHESFQDDESIRELLQKRGEKAVASFVVEKPENEPHQYVINKVIQDYVSQHYDGNEIDPDLIIFEQDRNDGRISKLYGKTQGENGSRYDVEFDKLFEIEPVGKSDDETKDDKPKQNSIEENESLEDKEEKDDLPLDKGSDDSVSDAEIVDDESNQQSSDDTEDTSKKTTDKEDLDAWTGFKAGDKFYAEGGKEIKVYAEAKITDNVILNVTPPKDARMLIGKVLDFVSNEEGEWLHLNLKRTNNEALNKGFVRKEDIIMN